jgi:hypothetical protein
LVNLRGAGLHYCVFYPFEEVDYDKKLNKNKPDPDDPSYPGQSKLELLLWWCVGSFF